MSLSRSLIHCVVASADPLQPAKMTCGVVDDLFQVYAASGTVRGLGIRGYEVTVPACAEIGMAIRNLSHRKLTLLDLSCCAVGDAGAAKIINSLDETTGEIHELTLRLCRLTPDFCKEISRHFFRDNLKKTSGLNTSISAATSGSSFGNLRALDLSFNMLGCEGVGQLLRNVPAGLQLDLSFTGVQVDWTTGLSKLEVGLRETQASSILLFGAGKTVTQHLQRKRKQSHAQKARQEELDEKIMERFEYEREVAAINQMMAANDNNNNNNNQQYFDNNYQQEGEGGEEVPAPILPTGGRPSDTAHPQLQYCRYGASSVTLYLDGDLVGAPNDRQLKATEEYLKAHVAKRTEQQQEEEGEEEKKKQEESEENQKPKYTALPPFNSLLLREVVTVTGEPLFVTPSYRTGRCYPSFVRGEIAGVNRVRDGRSGSSNLFSARSASCCLTARSSSAQNNNQRRSGSSARSSSSAFAQQRSASGGPTFSRQGTGNNYSRSASAYSRSASAGIPQAQGPAVASAAGSHNNNYTRTASAGSRSYSANQQQQQQQQDVVDPRSSSVLTTATTTTVAGTGLITSRRKPACKTPFARSSAPVVQIPPPPAPSMNNNTEPRTPVASPSPLVAPAPSPVSPSPIHETHNRPRAAVNATAAASAASGGGSAEEKEEGEEKKTPPPPPRSNQKEQEQEEQQEKTKNAEKEEKKEEEEDEQIPLVASHLSPRNSVSRGRVLKPFRQAEPEVVPDLVQENKLANLKLFLAAAVVSDAQCEKIFGVNPKKFLLPNSPLPPTVRRETGVDAFFPPVLQNANGVPSSFIRQKFGGEKRVAGIAKILYLLVFCNLAKDAPEWIFSTPAVDLPEFMRPFGDEQRTVIKFRDSRNREDTAARRIVETLIQNETAFQEQNSSSSPNSNHNLNDSSNNNNTATSVSVVG